MKEIPQKVFHSPLIGGIIFPNMKNPHALNRNHSFAQHRYETFEKCSILAKVKEGENFNHRNILDISRIEI